MDEKIAKSLINELEHHSGIIRPDKDLFFNILVSTDVSESFDFCEVLPDKKQLLEEISCYHYLSLRRILRNKNARNYQLSRWEKICADFMSTSPIYSSEVLERKLRVNKKLIEIMAQCKEPFSLLGKFKTYDFSNHRRELYSMTKPILIIPGVENTKPIYEWEKSNTTFKKEIRLMGLIRIQKRITSQEYFMA